MPYLTLSKLTAEVLLEIGLVTGTSVQFYTEPQIHAAINRIFNFIINKKDWEHLTSWRTYTLDGVNGYLTEDLSKITDLVDIYQIEEKDTRRKITQSIGPEHLDMTGTSVALWTPIPYSDATNFAKLIRFWPNTAVGSVRIKALDRPEKFVAAVDIIPFDSNIMSIGAAWYVLQGDGLNPGNAEKAQGMFEVAYQDYITLLNTTEFGPSRSYLDGDFTIQQ